MMKKVKTNCITYNKDIKKYKVSIKTMNKIFINKRNTDFC